MTPCRAKLRPVLSSIVGLALVAIGSAWTEARAQAWVGEKGSLEVGLDYNLGISDKIIDRDLELTDAGVTTHQLTLSGEYVPVPHLAVSVGLPFVAIQYTGNKTAYPHPGGG